jgi:hypothetical protein
MPDGLVAALSALIATLILWLRTSKLTTANPAFHFVGDDHVYRFMASRAPGSFHIGPFGWRILIPAVVRFLPVSEQTGFEAIAFASVAATGAVVFLTLRRWNFNRIYAVAGELIYFSMSYATRFNLRDFWLTDSAALFFVALAILALQDSRPVLFSIALLLGALAKESVIFVAPLYYTFEKRRFLDLRKLAETALLALPAVGALVALRFLIPAWNGDSAYVHSLPVLVQRDIGNLPSYDLLTVLVQTIHDRAHVLWPTIVQTVTSFGLIGIVLPAAGVRHFRPIIARFWPLLALDLTQLMFAMNTQRLVVVAFVPVLIACLIGGRVIAERYALADWWMLAVAWVAVALVLINPSSSSPAPQYQMAALALVTAAMAIYVWRGRQLDSKSERIPEVLG